MDISQSNPSLTMTYQTRETYENSKDTGNGEEQLTSSESLKVEQTITGKIVSNQTFYPLEESGSQTKENIPVSRPRLSILSENSVSSQPAEEGQVVYDSREEPLVDLSSGVRLTPVTCPDEASVWARAESKDSGSPGNGGLPVAMQLFAGSNGDSSVSRWVKLLALVQQTDGGFIRVMGERLRMIKSTTTAN